jgi:pimeloyl-ACP methyl ester carboxylesterase
MTSQNLTYIESGEGLPVVFLHGFCETKELWFSYLDPLSKICRVILMDLPGFGENPPLDGPITIADMAEMVYATMVNMGIDQCMMIGHSMGGYVALAFSEKFPSRLKGLGLFHSTAYSDSIEKKQARDKTIEFIERYGTEEFVEEFVPPLFFEGRRKDFKDEVRMMVEMGKKAAKTSVIESIRAMRDRKDRSKVLEKSQCPVLFIVGKNDIAIPFQGSQGQYSIPSYSTIHILNNTGHMGMIEWEKETLFMVEQFIQRIKKFYI